MAVTIKDTSSLYIVEIDKGIMVPIVRTAEELFSNTITRAQRLGGFDVCINAVWYDLTKAGYVDAGWGSDPIPAKETLNQGEALLATGTRYGNSEPAMFYAGQHGDWTWEFGFGDLPNKTDKPFRTGISGLCPLVINGLQYGTGNQYKKGVPVGAPSTGEPNATHKPYLIQRNNNRYVSLAKYPNGTGKTGFGVTKDKKIYVIVQHHKNPGVSFDGFRDTFINLGCINALACDGSDSVLMYRNKQFVVDAAITISHDKIETMTCGIGFKERK